MLTKGPFWWNAQTLNCTQWLHEHEKVGKGMHTGGEKGLENYGDPVVG